LAAKSISSEYALSFSRSVFSTGREEGEKRGGKAPRRLITLLLKSLCPNCNLNAWESRIGWLQEVLKDVWREREKEREKERKEEEKEEEAMEYN